MYKLSYEKCLCFLFLVVLVFLSCSGFHTDRLVTTLTDPYKKYPFSSNIVGLSDSELVLSLDSTSSSSTNSQKWFESDHFPQSARRRRRNSISHNRHRSERQSNRRRQRKFCPGQDVGTRAYYAKTIIEGIVRSSTSRNKKTKTYSVTVNVKKIHRNESGPRPLNITDNIRLHFAVGQHKGCDNKRVNGLVRAQLENGKEYIFFLENVGIHNYTVLGPPLPLDNKKINEIQNIVHKGKVKPAKIVKLSSNHNNTNARLNDPIKITCIVRGNPPPVVTWYKDGSEIRDIKKKQRIKHMERKSVLLVRQVDSSDAGQYECRAKGVIGEPASKKLNVQFPTTTEGTPCSPQKEEFCLNGGTCIIIESLNELACSCSNGFKGQRCENKDVTSETSGI